ncbi:MAG: phosphodiesterase [Lachnospirales bacterium]
MKIMFMSDIHGSVKYTQLGIEKFIEEEATHLVLLGDLMYHGPRNPLPTEYDPKEVATCLNKFKNKIIAIRGNCDSEVDQMLLEFPIMSDFTEILLPNYKIFATHGHIYDKNNMPPLNKGDIFIHGHFHLPMAEKINDIFYLNPGSITLPKENNKNSYGILNNDIFSIKDLEGNVIKEIKIL